MRVIGTLLLLAALALSVYNTLELSRLRKEMAGVRSGVAAQSSAAAQEARAKELRRQAQEHATKSVELLKKGDTEGASREMKKSQELIAEADKGGDTNMVGELRDLVSRVRGKGTPQPANQP